MARNHGAGVELSRYRSHKDVWAAKILQVHIDEQGGANPGAILGIEGGMIEVDQAYMDKHKPQAGGYYVRYADGYESWSPAKAFEEGYTRVSP